MTRRGSNVLLFEDYTTCNSALEVCRNHLVDQVLDRQLNRSKLTGEEEEEISENKETFLDTLKKPAAARK
jgi:membrane-associated HD superfamily phosphohydrolase